MSQESYRLFINICDLYLVLLQVMLFLVVWDIFFRPEKGKNEMLFAGIFAAINVLVRLCPGVPGRPLKNIPFFRFKFQIHTKNPPVSIILVDFL